MPRGRHRGFDASGIVNAANSAPVGLPNASIAQGSIFTIHSQNMGLAVNPPLSWPLKAEDRSNVGLVSVRGVLAHHSGRDEDGDEDRQRHYQVSGPGGTQAGAS